MRTRTTLFLITVFVILGCTSSMVIKPGSQVQSQYAPVNESTRRGIVKYLNQGASFVIEQRRKHAYRRMYTECGGKYRIVAEGPRLEGGVIVPVGYFSARYGITKSSGPR